MMNFDPTAALDYARRISRPRRVGCDEEKQVAQEIAEHLEQSGFQVNSQHFQCSTALDTFLSAEIIFGQVLILSTLLTYGISPWLTLVQCGLLVSMLLLVGPLNRRVQTASLRIEGQERRNFWSGLCWHLGAHFRTVNIIADLPDSSAKTSIPHLLLVAHYDSKSQKIPLVIRITLFVILLAGGLIFAGLGILALMVEGMLPVLTIIGGLVIFCAMPLLFLDYGNFSPGAIDNASGAGLVLHLAEIIASHSSLVGRIRITLLITGAEELGVKGAMAYLQNNETYLRRRSQHGGVHILNLDGIGVEGKLFLVGSGRRDRSTARKLYQLVRESGRELGIPVGRFSLPGALYDHIPFEQSGFDAISIISIGKMTWWVHTPKDSPDKLHQKGVEQSGRLAIRVINKLSGAAIHL